MNTRNILQTTDANLHGHNKDPQMIKHSRISQLHRFNTAISFVSFLLAVGIGDASAAETNTLTNADVLKMLESKLPESVIIAKVQASEVKFDTSTDAIIELNKKGVSEKVLTAMITPKNIVGGSCKTTSAPQVETPSMPPAIASDKPSALSYGTATGLVKKGVTTQREIIDLFGGADVMTTDKDGTEVWMYDKKTTTVSTSGTVNNSKQEKSEASQMAAYLGIPLIAGGIMAKERAKTDSVEKSQNTGEVKTSAKNITFIIKFNENKTVKDFAVRQSSY